MVEPSWATSGFRTLSNFRTHLLTAWRQRRLHRMVSTCLKGGRLQADGATVAIAMPIAVKPPFVLAAKAIGQTSKCEL